jgi:hypothetical protein
MAERNLPTAQSQAGGQQPVVRRKDTSNAGVDILQGAASLVNTFQRASAAEAKQAAAARSDADDITIGNMLADRNQIDLDLELGAQASAFVQESARTTARFEADGVITKAEESIVKQYVKDVGTLDQMKAQNPAQFSTQRSNIKKKLAFQQVLRENPRLGAQLVSARNSMNAGPDPVSGAQVKKVMEYEKRVRSIYGDNPEPHQLVEFAEFAVMNDNNKEQARRNDIKAQTGELTLTNIMQHTTANLDLAIATTSTKFNTELKAGGGFGRTENVDVMIQGLNTLRSQLITNVHLSVAKQNSGGKAIIDRAAVNKQVAEIEKQIQDTITVYKDASTLGLMKEISEYQTNWLKINGGNVASSAKILMGIHDGDNMGSMMAMNAMMNGTTAEATAGWEEMMEKSGVGGFSASKEQFAGQLAIMMANGVPIPKNLHHAAVTHGILAARSGPIDTNTQGALLDGVTTMATDDSIPSATNVLLDAAVGRRLSGTKLKSTVSGMDAQVKLDLRDNSSNVAYNPETDQLIVFNPAKIGTARGQMSRSNTAPEPFNVEELFEDAEVQRGRSGRVNPRRSHTSIDGAATKDLNALYKLRTSGMYSDDLETGEAFVKDWLGLFSLKTDISETPVDSNL